LTERCCPVCGVPGAAYLEVRHVPEPFRVLRCPTCQAGFSDIDPPAAAQFVDAPYPHEGMYHSEAAHFEREAQRYLRFVRRAHRDGGRLLDVGCGVGFFLRAAMAAGFEVEGLDVSASAVRAANARIGSSRARVCTSLDALPRNTRFDVVTFWNSLEHMPDPVGTLTRALDLLTPAGTLALEVPVDDALVNRLHHGLYVVTRGRLTIAHRLYGRTLEGHVILFTARSFRMLECRLPLRIVDEERHNTDVEELLGKHAFSPLVRWPARMTLRLLMAAATLARRQNRLDIVLRRES
jgi:SAM-dependent methyltransferase